MNFDLSEEQTMIQDSIARFVQCSGIGHELLRRRNAERQKKNT